MGTRYLTDSWPMGDATRPRILKRASLAAWTGPSADCADLSPAQEVELSGVLAPETLDRSKYEGRWSNLEELIPWPDRDSADSAEALLC